MKRGRGIGWVGAAWLASCVVLGCQMPAQGAEQALVERAARLAGVPSTGLVPDLRPLTPAPSPLQPPALLRALQAEPLQAPVLARSLRADYAAAARSASALFGRTAALYVDGTSTTPPSVPMPAADDALAAALQRLWLLEGQPWAAQGLSLPPDIASHRPLRTAVARMLHAIVDAESARRKALAAVPAELTPAVLLAQVTGSAPTAAHEALLRGAVAGIDRDALARGMLGLVQATEHLAGELPALAASARVDWQWSTPWGEVRIDTTGTDGAHLLHDPLLVVDVVGNDHYRFVSRGARNRIAVLLDIGGNDHYEALAPGSDVSAGVLGYGLLWDSAGDDRYNGGWLAQGAAVFGAALLVDAGGHDHYEATGLAQGYALAGVALVADLGGDDHYAANTYAQASAGPAAVAVLFDAAGNDRYRLQAEPVVARSSQLPDRNTSMGQGAGRGLRATETAPGVAGGLGVLIDLAGDDHYSAQVFAQGAGYYLGAGLLVDGGGSDRFEAAWYAMAAAAHAGAGVLLKEGAGGDHYSASHSTSLGAAHDGSVAYFRDEGGHDRYRVGNLGLGAAQDLSVAVFVDAGGDDGYASAGCHVLGVVRHSEEMAGTSPGARGLGLFFDLGGGRDAYPPPCAQARDGASWTMDGAAGFAAGVDE